MMSIATKFAGFHSAASLLADRSLSPAQKRTALLTWRASLRRAPPAGEQKTLGKRQQLIREIEEALTSLKRQSTPEWT